LYARWGTPLLSRALRISHLPSSAWAPDMSIPQGIPLAGARLCDPDAVQSTEMR
jgi:hypothetical protein